MVKRLLVGLILGGIIGAIFAAVLVQGLGVMSFAASSLGAAGAYLAAALTGVLTGLVAGKPIWSADGKIEAGLKAFFGALIALGAMFVLRQWVHVDLDLSSLKASAGPTEIGQLPAVSLPIIAAVLGGFFELDNSGDKEEQKEGGGAKASDGKKVRVAGATANAEDELSDEEEPQQQQQKKRR